MLGRIDITGRWMANTHSKAREVRKKTINDRFYIIFFVASGAKMFNSSRRRLVSRLSSVLRQKRLASLWIALFFPKSTVTNMIL